MAKRLDLLSQKIKKTPPHIDSSFDYLNLSSFLTKQENVRFLLFVGVQVESSSVHRGRSYP